jgi:chromosome segregation ATPase
VEEICKERFKGINEKIAEIQSTLKENNQRMDKIEDKQTEISKENAKIDLILEKFDEKIDKIELTLDNIVIELKEIGNRLVANEVADEYRDKEGLDSTIIKLFLNKNSRMLLLLIGILGAGFLFMLGMNVGDIFKVLGGL